MGVGVVRNIGRIYSLPPGGSRCGRSSIVRSGLVRNISLPFRMNNLHSNFDSTVPVARPPPILPPLPPSQERKLDAHQTRFIRQIGALESQKKYILLVDV